MQVDLQILVRQQLAFEHHLEIAFDYVLQDLYDSIKNKNNLLIKETCLSTIISKTLTTNNCYNIIGMQTELSQNIIFIYNIQKLGKPYVNMLFERYNVFSEFLRVETCNNCIHF